MLFLAGAAPAQNPFIRDQFTADPSARVFNGRIYVYPSHDILADESRGRPGWFCMEDYHVFSSENLTDWTDHGVIVSQDRVPWVKPSSYSMWAPDCISRNGKYYFYFPSSPRDTTFGRGFAIGVAVSDSPTGPFVPQPEPIAGVHGIDPNVFIDKDGQAYLYWSARNIFVAKLKENMLELDSDPVVIDNLPGKGLKEGPYLFGRNGTYYLTYPHVEHQTERLEYAMGSSPMGPFRVTGVIMDESPTGCWTNHHSVINYKGQWYLFYHHNDLSPKFDKARSIRVDSLFFNEDGTIQKVTPTLRGVGITPASRRIQVDRYSAVSDEGASIAFLDTADAFKGWKTVLDSDGSWVRFNSVDFGNKQYTSIAVRASSETGGLVQVRLDRLDGPVIASVKIPAGKDWNLVDTGLSGEFRGVHDIILESGNSGSTGIDWIMFK